MAEVNINLKCDLQHAVKVQYLDGNLFSQDAAANTINIEVTDNGAPATIGGTVSANVIRPDGGTVAVTGGTISGNTVSITLPAACYALVGMISVIVKLTSDSTETTIAALTAYVYQSSTDTVVDPGTVISSIQDLIDAIDTAVASIPADYSSLWTSLAPAFSSSTAYTAGQYVTYNGGLYRFTKAHAAGSWASGDVVAVNLGGELSDVKSALSEEPLADYSPILVIVEGSSVKSSTGEIQENANLARSDYTDTQGATSFALVGYNPTNYCIYTKDKVYISGASSPGQSSISLPSTAKYIIFTAAIGHVYDIKLHLYNANTVISVIKDDIENIESYDLPGLAFNTNDSIVSDYTPQFSVVEGEQVNSSTGVISANANLGRSDYIPLRNAATISFSGQNVTNYVFFDINKAYVSGGTSPSTDILGVPSTAKYVMYTSQLSRLYGVVVHLYNAYGYMREALPWCRKKKINWIGDSIVAGEDFDEKVCGALDLIKANEYGIGGSTIALKEDGTDTRNAICVRYSNMSNDADIIAVSAGTNDFEYAWCPIGTINDPDDGTSNITFYGALKTLCKGLIDKYPQKVIFFTTPIKRAQPFESGNGGDYTPDNQMLTPFSKNKYGKTLMDYADIIKEVCGYYSIPVLDLNRESMLNPHIASQQDLFDSAYTHPNTTGQKIMARRVAGWIAQLEYLIPGLS